MTRGLGSGRERGRDSARVGRAADERGFTLVEMLIAVWILGAVMVAMIGALFTMTRTSDLASRRTAAETELRHFAEAIRAAPYQPCVGQSGYGNYDSVYTPAITGARAQVVGATFWIPLAPTSTADPTQSWGDVGTLQSSYPGNNYCPAGGSGGDAHAQKISLQLTVPTGTGSGTILLTQDIVKRDQGTW